MKFLDAMASHCVTLFVSLPQLQSGAKLLSRSPFLLGALYVCRATANRFLAPGHQTLKSQLGPEAATSHPRASTFLQGVRAA